MKVRRTAFLLLIAVSTGIFAFILRNKRPAGKLLSLSVSEEIFNSIKESRQKRDGLLIELSFDEVPLFTDSASDRWFWSIRGNDPVIQLRTEDSGARIAFSGDPFDPMMLRSGEGIPFIVYTNTEYSQYRLIPTTLPLLSIDYSGILDKTRTDVPFTFRLADNRPDALNPFIRGFGDIHKRGWSSITLPKANLKLTLYDTCATGESQVKNEWDAPLLGLRADGDWVLNSAYTDFEKVRNAFSTNLWHSSCAKDNEFGYDNGNEYRYLELFMNGEYWGLYSISYPIDAKQVQIYADQQGKYNEYLYKQQVWGPNIDGNPDWDGEILELPADDETTNNGRFLMKNYYQMLDDRNHDLIWNTDVKTTLDLYLWLRLIQAEDTVGIPGKFVNMMMAFKRSPAGYRMVYTPWDMDISWGAKKQSSKITNGVGHYKITPDDNSYEMTVNPVAVNVADGDPEIRSLLYERYRELRKSGWSLKVIDPMIDGFEHDIFGSGAFRRDAARWPGGNSADPELGLSCFREYVHARLLEMDRFVEENYSQSEKPNR